MVEIMTIMPKVCNFVWSLCRSTIPVKHRLAQKGMLVDTICEMCGEQRKWSTYLKILLM